LKRTPAAILRARVAFTIDDPRIIVVPSVAARDDDDDDDDDPREVVV
jgi:hypothetical protein